MQLTFNFLTFDADPARRKTPCNGSNNSHYTQPREKKDIA